MSQTTQTEGGLKLTRADGEPVDSLIASRRTPVRDVNGKVISTQELEAAAELSRVAHRFRLNARGIGGFQLYGCYALASRIARSVLRIK